MKAKDLLEGISAHLKANEELVKTWARLSNLLGLKAWKRQPIIFVVIAVTVVSFAPGAAPLANLGENGRIWLKILTTGYLLVWSLHVFSFLQREDKYVDLETPDKSVQMINADGNKSIAIYVILAVILVLQLLLQYFLTSEIIAWPVVLALLLHMLPAILGENLKMQARYLFPFFETVGLCIMMVLTITLG